MEKGQLNHLLLPLLLELGGFNFYLLTLYYVYCIVFHSVLTIVNFSYSNHCKKSYQCLIYDFKGEYDVPQSELRVDYNWISQKPNKRHHLGIQPRGFPGSKVFAN